MARAHWYYRPQDMSKGRKAYHRTMEFAVPHRPGVMIYTLPLGHGQSKAVSQHGWGTKDNSFWCCYGTGIESFSKLGDSIYFEQAGQVPGIYVIQYVSSSINWESGNVLLVQKVMHVVSWDNYLRVTISVSSKRIYGSIKDLLWAP
ncbi:hypothetical protein POM88_000497 [Heracleum sosnowskyi]|uniref:Non-reducing end beta-L-arabinofuranosidase-like GH127 catalytic domain-containing protein n=1 Tax=Heracleum sosnowskyi TaxID=360622 RepID=A0AAD8N9G3_9APIA|nr:hypothetical protein POM88_000497 [Heracleum sosnowskyi]